MIETLGGKHTLLPHARMRALTDTHVRARVNAAAAKIMSRATPVEYARRGRVGCRLNSEMKLQ